ncbi:MAG TPA: Smr/MutS family protein [Polyangiaceae bacterium]|nr:Smr/MutS family protein [Polyangiaceae bacterium]HNZ24696.1 Smr/MutS family protein [Polyangiaceae bacterium]HOD25470.1 Smr/MutS family protein [Polyangiaceae bacterium]HOE51699.1 Smr/MutS family protein [Polyangiaceae bacterium]HOH02684.1 Smr/MutS family protein [Polyangiaceae bacterium]
MPSSLEMSSYASGSSSAIICSEKTCSDLQWGRVLEALAQRAKGPLGHRAALDLTFCATRQQVTQALGQVKEAYALLQAGKPLPTGGAPILSPILERLRAGGALTPNELLSVAQLLSKARYLQRFLQEQKSRAPLLHESCATDPQLDSLIDQIQPCFEPDGSWSDRASSRLRELRQERHATRQRLLDKLHDIMQRYASTLQDDFYTERQGRFVLPVRVDSHERFIGIVHGTSASGQTLFMEPRAIIALGNKLKVVDAQIEREQVAITTRLSEMIREQIEAVAAAESALAHAELKAAAAVLAQDLDLCFPHFEPTPVMDLIQARHPLLQLDGVKVIPSDMKVESGHALIVSGPNAGGKTVVLKTLGLAACMIRAGLPIACDPRSRVGLFDRVATDMGDDQSISKNLSTFSAQVRNLAGILETADVSTLVLLDEIATGTDPRQGEALATGVLDGLCARGAAVACTTHYEGLKALALGDDRFRNASVGFDMSSMSPTFSLATGLPGASSALAIARRFGMPSYVLERAQQYLAVAEQGFDSLVAKLNDERRALELARSAAEREKQWAEARRRELDAELKQQRSREHKLLSEHTQGLLSAIQRAREELRMAQQRLRSKKLNEEALKEIKRTVDAVAQKVAMGGELEPVQAKTTASTTPLSPEMIGPGQRVYVPRLRAEAQIVDVLKQGQVRVALGAVKVLAHIDELRGVGASEDTPAPARNVRPNVKPARFFDAAADPDLPLQTSDNTCDLRGLRAEEAVAMAEQFLDRCLNEGRRVAFLIHGHGTGALRNAIRSALQTNGYVQRFRPGQSGEGGDGVTVAWLV